MQISVRLDENIGSKLEKLAQDAKRTKSFYIQEAIKKFLEDMSDYMDAVEELKTIENDPEPQFFTIDEAARELSVKI